MIRLANKKLASKRHHQGVNHPAMEPELQGLPLDRLKRDHIAVPEFRDSAYFLTSSSIELILFSTIFLCPQNSPVKKTLVNTLWYRDPCANEHLKVIVYLQAAQPPFP